MSKKVKYAFLISFLMNVLLAGVLLGERFDREVPRRQRTENAAKELREPFRAQVLEKLERMRRETEPAREQIRAARDEAIRIWTAEPFDEAGYDREVSKISELRTDVAKRWAETFRELGISLPPEQRSRLVEVLKRPPAVQ
jgi:uncharacterized membrane protein